jgi:hypothetical protein
MPKFSNDPVISNTTAPSGVDNYNGGIVGTSTLFNGVLGYTTADGHAGVAGACDEGNGNGVYGRSKNRNGVYGVSSAKEHSGVVGQNENGTAVLGRSVSGNGVWGLSDTGIGVVAQTRSTVGPALAAYQSNPNSNWAALHAKHDGGKLAAVFEGDVQISGNVLLAGSRNLLDCLQFPLQLSVRILFKSGPNAGLLEIGVKGIDTSFSQRDTELILLLRSSARPFWERSGFGQLSESEYSAGLWERNFYSVYADAGREFCVVSKTLFGIQRSNVVRLR